MLMLNNTDWTKINTSYAWFNLHRDKTGEF